MGFWDSVKKVAKQVTGVQAYEDKHEAERLTAEADRIKGVVERENCRIQNELNQKIQEYQSVQESVLKATIGVFREFLKDLPFGREDKEYSQIGNIDWSMFSFKMPEIHLKTKEILKTVAAGVAFGVFAAGYVASKYYSEKLTEATKYHRTILEYRASCEKQWALCIGIAQRANEQKEVLQQLEIRASAQLDYLKPLIYEFMVEEEYYVLVMEKTRVFLKPIVDICKTPLVDDYGKLNTRWNSVKVETTKILERNF